MPNSVPVVPRPFFLGAKLLNLIDHENQTVEDESEFIDGIGEGRLENGSIALQLHDDQTIVQFKDILLKQLR